MLLLYITDNTFQKVESTHDFLIECQESQLFASGLLCGTPGAKLVQSLLSIKMRKGWIPFDKQA